MNVDKEYYAVIGERIKKVRIEKGLSQKELAIIIKSGDPAFADCSNVSTINNPTICNWEAGISLPPYDTFLRLCYALNVSPNYLLGYDDTLTQEHNSQCFLSPEDVDYEVNKNSISKIRQLKKENHIDYSFLASYLRRKGYRISIADLLLMMMGHKVPSMDLLKEILNILQ